MMSTCKTSSLTKLAKKLASKVTKNQKPHCVYFILMLFSRLKLQCSFILKLVFAQPHAFINK